MNIVKYVFLFIWALLLLGIVFYLIKRLVFGKRKSSQNINISEAVYLSSLIIAAGIVFQKVIQSIAISFDNILKIQPTNIYFQFIKTSSAISVTGIILFIIALYMAKFLSALFFGKRKDIVEFESDNKPYAIIRGTLIFSVSFVFLQVAENIFNYLMPSIAIPFYR